MKRTDLYEKVWSTPMIRLAAELGISDVGLAKACRRHAIPVPPRGHWAKLQAGKKSPRAPLPAPELDVDVEFSRSDPQERARLNAAAEEERRVIAAQTEKIAAKVNVAMVADLARAHPLVKATQKYCERLPKLIERYKRRGFHGWTSTKPGDLPAPEVRGGRYALLHRDLLDITASLDDMDWVLRFHATLFKGFTDAGMTIVRRTPESRGRHGHERGPAVELASQKETFRIRFSQGYSRRELAGKELEALRKEERWASSYEFRAADRFTFSLEGTEYSCNKSWTGTKNTLEARCAEIVRAAIELVPLQAERRRQRLVQEAESQRRAAIAADQHRRAQARAEQVKHAIAIMEANDQRGRLLAFLEQLQLRGKEFAPPYDDRVATWIKVVRAQLNARDPVAEMLHECLSVPSWATWPPAWWPEQASQPADSDQDEAH